MTDELKLLDKPDPKDRRIMNIELEAEEQQILKAIARRKGIGARRLARMILADWIERQPTTSPATVESERGLL